MKGGRPRVPSLSSNYRAFVLQVRRPVDACALMLFEDVGGDVGFAPGECCVIEGSGPGSERAARPGDLRRVPGQRVDDGIFGVRGAK